MFSKNDQQFVDMAVDGTRRRAAIADLSRRRTLMFWCACVGAVLSPVAIFCGGPTGAVLGIGALTQWMIVFRFESDLRLLSVIERLQDGERQSP